MNATSMLARFALAPREGAMSWPRLLLLTAGQTATAVATFALVVRANSASSPGPLTAVAAGGLWWVFLVAQRLLAQRLGRLTAVATLALAVACVLAALSAASDDGCVLASTCAVSSSAAAGFLGVSLVFTWAAVALPLAALTSALVRSPRRLWALMLAQSSTLRRRSAKVAVVLTAAVLTSAVTGWRSAFMAVVIGAWALNEMAALARRRDKET